MLLVQVFCVAMLRVAITIECFGFLRVKVDLQMHLVAFPHNTPHTYMEYIYGSGLKSWETSHRSHDRK